MATMNKDIHAASNRAIARYMSKEVTVTLTRGDADYVARLVRDDMNRNWDNLTDEQRHEASQLYYLFSRAN